MYTINYKPSFADLEIPQAMRERADVLFFKKGQIVYQEGSTPLGAYFVDSGQVKISMLGSLGKEKIVKIVTDSELLCFSDLFSHRRYSTSAQAMEETSLLFISKRDFWEVLNDRRDIFLSLLWRLSEQIKVVQETITDLAYKPVRGRLADAILNLNNKIKGKDLEYQSISLTRADLAGYVGTVKETVNRLLSELREEKIISTSGSRIVIRDMDKLIRISEMYN
ncbi:Crp/Fnr family transcriptional regulator [Christiangramia crocea]|uniref:Crp/Fnr family transcriptional regulator n=1 Tax=Christiangramia crocea TaxID=2904124 RepID=A0A9X1UVD1_9FLAO|nr:Crp/Fnr family transcriptional regulator [Gramella crocea]MCG9970796.1 Crp/Fnr family transcriptional regulator [Gramella crocea]